MFLLMGDGGGGMRVLKNQLSHCQDISSDVIGHVIYHWRYHLTCYILTQKKKKNQVIVICGFSLACALLRTSNL